MQPRRVIILADVKQVQDPKTLRTEWKVVSGTQTVGDFQPMGAQTFFQANAITTQVYREKIAIRKAFFNRQQIVYEVGNGKLYEFVTFQPYFDQGRENKDMMWLLVKEITNQNIINALNDWRIIQNA